ncbi:hypothetical protein [Devosia sp. SD17-2]|uniref:hypothetical protein n=1 Tax=Devosia sp. SD17-2 TaxID=2976459 RepID=UPI0023D89606|nr:hypothetical protein [Devosia sp. SD17-2]WEJ32570.1 hypothetical protein NYQ88_17020 [Devosia sp. SD17-2]
MTKTPTRADNRPSGTRLAAIVFLGPLVGTILGVGGLFLADPPDEVFLADPEFSLVILSFGYLFGLVPAMLAAFAYWAVYPAVSHWSPAKLIPLCLGLGAISGVLGIIIVVSTFENRLTVAMPITALGAWAGAIALTATALPFRKRPS